MRGLSWISYFILVRIESTSGSSGIVFLRCFYSRFLLFPLFSILTGKRSFILLNLFYKTIKLRHLYDLHFLPLSTGRTIIGLFRKPSRRSRRRKSKKKMRMEKKKRRRERKKGFSSSYSLTIWPFRARDSRVLFFYPLLSPRKRSVGSSVTRWQSLNAFGK